MKSVLIILIGNRDIQLKKESNILQKYRDLWIVNNDDQDFMIIDKSKSFLKSSKLIYDQFDRDFRNEIVLPMIEQSISEIPDKLDVIHLVTSRQNPMDEQDCYYFGLTAQKILSQKYAETKLTFFDCNPTEFDPLMKYFLKLYNDYEGYKLFIGNSGGTPDMRAATYMAGVFRDIQYITINARTKTANINNFKSQENAIIKHIVSNMLKVYDFEGIKYLPVPEQVKKECNRATDLYNLILDSTNKSMTDDHDYSERARSAIMLLINNMEACYRQGRYTEVIGRIFRIEEAIWQLLFFLELKNKNLTDDKSRIAYSNSNGKISHIKYERFLSEDQLIRKILETEYSELIEGDCFRSFPNVPLKSGKNFFYYFFRSIDTNVPVCDFFEKINGGYDLSKNKLSQLRNKSIMGHGFMGISDKDIYSIVGPFEKFIEDLVQLVEKHLDIKYSRIFLEANQKILDHLNHS